jgi:hypothetical protein
VEAVGVIERQRGNDDHDDDDRDIHEPVLGSR